MLKEAWARKGVKLEMKEISNVTIYNHLQDMRHLMIIDVRDEEEFKRCWVRKAVLVEKEGADVETLRGVFKESERMVDDKLDT